MSDEKIVHLPMIRDEARSTVYDTDYPPLRRSASNSWRKCATAHDKARFASHTDWCLR